MLDGDDRRNPARKGSMTRRGQLTSWMIAGALALSGAVAEAQDATGPGTAKPRACVPGIQISCPCPGGAPPGIQVCDGEGSRYSPCACTAPPGAPILPPKSDVPYEYSNVTLMISGIVLLGIGNVNIVTGVVLYQRDEARHVTPAEGLITIGLGIAAAILSPALIIPGALRVPVSPTKAKASSVTIEPTPTGLRFTF